MRSEFNCSGRENDIVTLISLGCIAYFITVMGHEILGHGVAMYLHGVRSFALTSTSIADVGFDWSGKPADWAFRAIPIAGSAFNFFLGAALYPMLLHLRRSNASPLLHFGVWLLVVLNLSFGFVYFLFSGVFGVGDWAAAISGLPYEGLLRSGEILIGLAGLFFIARLMGRELAEFQGSLMRLAWIPYVSAVIVYCTVGLRVPDPYIILISVFPAPILGQIALFLAPLFVRRASAARDFEAAKSIPRSWATASLAAMCVVATWFIAPGVEINL